ncbi:MAG TPA: DEAD/DEAH box helicase, partial [Candidatus Binatia bacterium]|nr:DEAD/DEAH box helicase [Candidatus Binatia bacterium]
MAATSQSGLGALAVRGQSTLDTVQDALASLAGRYRADEVLTSIKHIPARDAQFRPMPDWVRPELSAAYRAKGIEQLYSHQAASAELARAGKNFVVVTPTASGKTLCYNLPILNAVLENRDTRALYLFPTKLSRRISSPNCRTSPRGSTISSAYSPMTAIHQPMRARRFANAGTWC